MAVAGAGADAEVVGQAEQKIGEAGATGKRNAAGGDGGVGGVLAVKVEKAGEAFDTREEEIVPVIIELNANVKFVIAVGLYDRVADLEDGVGESVELAKIVGDGADATEQAADGRKERAGRAGDSELHRQVLAGWI
jgi:hypothetical protein